VLEIHNGPGELTAKYTYDAWGKLISITDASGAALGTNSFAYHISVRYRGYIYDNETGLYYLQSRYYDPEVCRFINCDDVHYIGTSESEVSYNPFAYCENDAVNNVDPSGYAVNVHVSVKYFYNSYAGRNSLNQHIFIFQYLKYGYNYDYSDPSQIGKSYFPAIVVVWDKKYIKLDLCFESNTKKKGIAANKKYLRAFSMENMCYYLAEYSMQCYKQVFSKKYPLRSVKGIELEILLHFYMYYFDIDKNDNYASSKEVDIDNRKDGLLIEIFTSSSLINRCKKALKNKKADKAISKILKTVYSKK